MTASRQNNLSEGRMRDADETLRAIARMPAPDGLVERVQAGLRNAPRSTRLLHWRSGIMPGSWMYSSAFRGAAAAAIVCVVAGGGWRIYSRVQPAPTAKVIVMPARVGNQGFSNAGAMRTPDTLTGPVIKHAVVPGVETSASAASGSSPAAGARKGVAKSPRPKKPAVPVQ